MCGRFTLTADPGDVARRFGAPPAQGGGTTPRYNIAPTQTVITVTGDGTRQLEQMRWGLVPRWAKDPKMGSRMINARAETLAEKPAFRDALRRRRALIPADGFFEWAPPPPGRRSKQPMHVRLRSGEPFAFAGLWDEWRPPEGGEPVRTCTIITTEPNELMATFHHRMPVILAPEVEALWLDPEVTDTKHLRSLLVPYPAGEMTAYAVSPDVNAVTNDFEQLVLPLDLPV
jgi:putative SOS response-associated peptidase YedK